jgi:hypothetical protein
MLKVDSVEEYFDVVRNRLPRLVVDEPEIKSVDMARENQVMQVKSAENFNLNLATIVELISVMSEANNNLKQVMNVLQFLDQKAFSEIFPIEIDIPMDKYSAMTLKVSLRKFLVHIKPAQYLFELTQPDPTSSPFSSASQDLSIGDMAPLSQMLQH